MGAKHGVLAAPLLFMYVQMTRVSHFAVWNYKSQRAAANSVACLSMC